MPTNDYRVSHVRVSYKTSRPAEMVIEYLTDYGRIEEPIDTISVREVRHVTWCRESPAEILEKL